MMKKKKINIFEQPPMLYAMITVDSASIVRQTYNVITGQYYPDRTLVPLVLIPSVSYLITESGVNVENAASQLINGKWWRISQKDGKREITNDGNTYTIDNAPGSATYGKLTTKENVDPDNPVTYLFEATLNRGTGYKVSASFSLDSVTLEVHPDLYFDNDTQAMYNPWDPDMPKDFTIHPVISPKGLEASFKWQMLVEDVWTDLGDSFFHWAVQADGNGVTIDRSVMPSEIALKCIASVTVNGLPTTVEKIVTHNRRLPAFDTEIIGVGDIPEGAKTISPQALIQTGRSRITDPGDEAGVDWYGSGSAPVAHGMNPDIPVSALGTAMEVGVDVTDKGGYKLLVDGDGAVFTDDNGVPFILK